MFIFVVYFTDILFHVANLSSVFISDFNLLFSVSVLVSVKLC